jgi:hypothetical protein
MREREVFWPQGVKLNSNRIVPTIVANAIVFGAILRSPICRRWMKWIPQWEEMNWPPSLTSDTGSLCPEGVLEDAVQPPNAVRARPISDSA